MQEAPEVVEARQRMVREQLEARGIRDRRVLDAMRRVPRHVFVDPALWSDAYGDHPLGIGFGQTISQPYIVARLAELAAVEPGDRALEIGTGSGYQAAVLAQLAREVHGVERYPELAARAEQALGSLGLDNVHVAVGDGSRGLPGRAPFDVIVVSAGAPQVPVALVEQLAEGGRLVIPVGQKNNQVLTVVRRSGGSVTVEQHDACRFVDLVGRFGWGGELPPQA